MALYIYKAANRNGDLVRNRVEEVNKYVLLKKLKSNGLLPIEIIPIKQGKRIVTNKQKRNVESINSVLKTVREREIEKNVNSRYDFKTKLKKALNSNVGQRIKVRDVMIFTQNFYLLKKANFNNIHALTTILQTTENASFKAIIEDILLGVESRRKYVYYNGILY